MRLLLILMFSPPIVFILYDFIFYYIPLNTISYPYITADFILQIIMADIWALLLTVIFFARSRFRTEHSKMMFSNEIGIPIKFYCILFISTTFLFFFLVHSVFDSYDLLNVYNFYAKFYALTKRGTAWVFIILNVFLFLMVYDFYLNGIRRTQLFLFLGVLLVIAMTGGRSFCVLIFLFVFFIQFVLNYEKIKFNHCFMIILFSSLIFLGNAYMRAGSIDTYFKKFTKFDFNAAFILNDVMKYNTKNDTSYFNFIDDFYYMLLPRYIYPDKPLSSAETRLVYPEVAYRGTNYTFGIYGNALINVGNFAIISIFLYLLISSYLWFYLIKNDTLPRRNSLKFICLFLLFYSLQFIRGGIFNSRIVLILASIIIAQILYGLIQNCRMPQKEYKNYGVIN